MGRASFTNREHCGAIEPPGTQVGEGAVGVFETEPLDARLESDLRNQREQLLAISSRQVRDRTNGALLPEQPIRKRRNVRHVNPAAHHHAAGRDRGKRDRDQLTGGREDDCRVELHGWPLVGITSPYRSDLAGERLATPISGARERIHVATEVARDLRDQVTGGAEPVDPETTPLPASRSAR